MKILAVDSEPAALQALCCAIREAVPSAQLLSFSSATEALAHMAENALRPDAAFLETQFQEMTGLELGGILKMIYPSINLIFVTNHVKYAREALSLRASGYLIKPIAASHILTELENLRYPMPTLVEKPIRIQCFGSFEVFVHNEPVQFSRTKSKELLAYLVDRRGARSTAASVASVLWEDGFYDRSRQKQFSVIRLDLLKSLQRVGAECILLRSRDALAVNPETFSCDYYLAMSGDSAAVNTFLGEYMMPYPWAELTTATLVSKFGDQYA